MGRQKSFARDLCKSCNVQGVSRLLKTGSGGSRRRKNSKKENEFGDNKLMVVNKSA